uniref:Uncharacterized protein n=1 Tax=Octactis speculum TaxID=3111310 RepID=A0A7S2HIZ6_9STRA
MMVHFTSICSILLSGIIITHSFQRPFLAPKRLVHRKAVFMSSDLNEPSRPGFRVSDSDDASSNTGMGNVRPRRRRLNDRLMDEISVIESTLPPRAPVVEQVFLYFPPDTPEFD